MTVESATRSVSRSKKELSDSKATKDAKATKRDNVHVVTMVEAVNLALRRALNDDPDVVVLGEDIGINGGVFRATLGLRETFGYKRVIDTP
ncbi:MAG: hypothetical protein WD600_04710, partial [Pseudohongiella sp.]